MTGVKLGDVAEFVNGFAFSESDWESEGIPIIRIQNLTEPLKPFNRTRRAVSDRYFVAPGDLLVSWSATLGVFSWAGPEIALVNQHIFRVVPDETRVLRSYLRHVMSTALTSMERHLHGATMKHVNRGQFLETIIPVPPLEEQRRIASILDQADDLQARRRQTLTLLDDLAQSIFVDMFSECSVEQVRAGDLMPSMRNGVSPSTGGAHPANVLTLSAVTQGRFDAGAVKLGLFDSPPESSKRVSALDFLVCRGNGNRGLVGVGTFSREDRPDLVFPDTVIAGRVDPGRVTLPYLEFVWRQPTVRRQIEAVARTTNGTYKVNQQTLEGVVVPLAPLAKQSEFVSVLERVGELRLSHLQASVAEVALASSLQSQAFQGGF